VLPKCRAADVSASRWPAALRWLERLNLETLERVVLRSKRLQCFVLARHRAAFEALLREEDRSGLRNVAIVGGGLFPRTALVLQKILPDCALTVVEENPDHIAIARCWLNDRVEYVLAHYDEKFSRRFDAVVIPLAFHGVRAAVCANHAGTTFFVHDWIWRRAPASEVVSWLLLKRLNRIDT
jgi:hypothetical protein